MTTIAQVRDTANVRLATLWTNVILPKQIAWFAEHGEYAQILYTKNLPENASGASPVQELVPDTDLQPGDRPGMTAKAVFGAVSIDVQLPFALATTYYNGPSGKGFVGQVWVKFDGTIYTRAKNYGPEEWRTHDWQVFGEEQVVVASFTETYLPTFTAAYRATADATRRTWDATVNLFRRA